MKNSKLNNLDKNNTADITGLTPLQEGMLFHYLKDPEGHQYVEQLCLEISGEIVVKIFEKAWNVVVETNEMLRTIFRWERVKHPLQLVLKKYHLKPNYYDLANIKTSTKHKTLRGIIRNDREKKFDLRKITPPFRVTLCKIEPKKYQMIVSNHHILYDGWSNAIILKEFFKAYNDLAHQRIPLKPIKSKFKEYIKWLKSQDKKKQEKYWRQYLKGVESPTELSIKMRKAKEVLDEKERVQHTEKHHTRLGRDNKNKIEKFVKKHQITLAALFYSTWGILLQKYNNCDDVLFGSTVSGRSAKLEGIEDMVGLFINTLPLRVKHNLHETVTDMLNQVNHTLKAREEYESTSLADINQYSQLANQGKLFDSLVVLENYPLDSRLMFKDSKLSVDSYSMDEVTNYDLTVGIVVFNDIDMDFVYNAEYFDPGLIKKMAGHFSGILEEITKNPDKKVHAIDILSEQEKQQLLVDFNDTTVDYPRDKTIHQFFAQQAEQTPDYIAVTGPLAIEYRTYMTHMTYISYRELNEKSNQLASLLKEKGVKSDTIVGILLERSIDMIIGILAILKAGGAYVPIDPKYPEERIKYILKDSNAGVLVTTPKLQVKVKAEVVKNFRALAQLPLQFINLETRHESTFEPSLSTLTSTCQASPENLVYIIYTSGTTGKPKGVMVQHSSVVNLVFARKRQFNIDTNDRILQFYSLSFDASVEQTFIALISGATLVLIEKNTLWDINKFESFITNHLITHIDAVPSFLNSIEWKERAKDHLKRIISGGDVCPVSLAKKLSRCCDFYNAYGPTETTVTSIDIKFEHIDETLPRLPIGRPIKNTSVYLFDQWLKPVPLGVIGELYIGGAGVARGYLNRPELTAKKFVEQVTGAGDRRRWEATTNKKFLQGGPRGGVFTKIVPSGRRRKRIYRSGDLARWLPDGNIEFTGRIDHQVKIRGFRIELREIENQLLRHPLVKEAIVIDNISSNGDKYLCAYIVTLSNRLITPVDDELRKYLSKELPGYMIPSFFVKMERLPKTPSGKPDRRSLPEPGFRTEREYIAPRDEIEKKLAKIWAEILAGQSAESISINDKFFEIGGNSLTIIRLSSRLQKVFGKQVPVVTLFRCTTIREQARFLTASNDDGNGIDPVSRKNAVTAMDVVVIGMAGRFPGARDIHEFQDNLEKGIESITFFNDRELQDAGIIPEIINNPHYIKARGFLQDADCFDAAFFDYSPGNASLMDPQVRLFHECCWEALEDAGYVPNTYHGPIGLYAGASPNITWMMSNIHGKMSPSEQYELLNLNGPSFTTLVSYKLNLKGPVLSIQTTCSTSSVAVDTACQSLLRGTCDMALAGGVFLFLPNTSGYPYQEGMILSPDGHCRTFDEKAAGTMTGNGVGIVVLKPMDRAMADGDHIYGVIKGSAINNDGQRKVGYSAPSVEGQAEVVRAALATAGLEPETIGYIEAHGTGTPLGDPVEIEGLKLAFNTSKRNYCGIGSVKSNIGHLDAAAGIAGLIKALLILKHKKIPPTINCETPNPAIDFANSPFYINTRLREWKQDRHPRRVGVSSFGIGGTNAHLVLEEWSAPRDAKPTLHSTRSHQLILLSAKTQQALERATQNLAEYFNKNPGISLADAAYTLQQGRKAFKYRRMLVCRDTAEAVALLTVSTPHRVYSAAPVRENPPLIFMFPGQGSQYVNMGRELYEKEPVFRQEMDRCFEILKPLMGYDIKEILYPVYRSNRSHTSYKSYKSPITQTEIAQPVLFAFEYALARLLMSWGNRPTAMIGHSIGEYVAACLAGVFSLEDALEIVTKRGQLMQQLPAGAMLGVPLSENEITSLLKDQKELSLAAVNSTTRSVISGPHEAVVAFEKTLQARGYETQRLHTSHAFHSTMMNSILESFETTVRGISRAEPQIPYISNVTGQWITGQEVENPGYWSRQLRETVRFADGLSQLFKKEQYLFFLEVGPGKTLTTFARQHEDKGVDHTVENLVRHPREKTPDLFLLLTRLGQLWLQGNPVDWSGFHGSSPRQRISLPCYPFERRSFNIDINITRETGNHRQISAAIADEAVTGGMGIPLEKKKNMAHWFYTPSWKRSHLVVRKHTGTAEPLCYLVFTDSYPDINEIRDGAGLGYGLVKQLKQAPGIGEVIVVSRGNRFLKKKNSTYQIRPTRPDDYDHLLYELYKQDKFPHRIVHLWSLIDNDNLSRNRNAVDIRQVEAALDTHFYSLIYTARAIGKHHITQSVDLSVVTPGMQDVTGAEPLKPQHAAVLGVASVIPQEYPGINCRSIDIVVPQQETRLEKLTTQLLAEIDQINPNSTNTVVAIRENHRWVRTFAPLRLEEDIEEKPLLRERGVYLVTGGLGNIGRALAKYLAVQAKARLILTGRTPLPPKDQWSGWLAAHNARNPISRKISTLQHLEVLGAEVLVQTADAANESQMETVIRQAEQRFGCINGVFHAAHIGEKDIYRTIKEITREDCRNQFHPKIKGVLVLEKVLRKLKEKPDFCLLMSSLASVLGGLGFAAYSAANAFMDAFTHYQNRTDDVTWISVNWDAWQLESNDTHRFSPSVGMTLAQLAVTKEEGIAVFDRVLSWGEAGQIVHSTADLQTRLDRSRKSGVVKKEKKQHSTRPHLSIPYTAPRNSLEQSIAGIWESFFGFESLGIHDDFYELGGDSLKAVTIVSSIQSTLKVDIPLTVLFDSPTIEGLAAYITNNTPGSSFSAIEPVEKREYYQLSSAQKRLFFLDQFENIGTSYNMPVAFKLIGRVDKKQIKHTFHALTQRHEILRTSFHSIDEVPIQRVHNKVVFEMDHHSLVRPFDLSQPPLLRVRIREISETEHLLLFDLHHIISDGISIQVLMDEFLEIYSGTEPPALHIQYKDFSTWQNQLFESGRIKAQEDYWLNRFADADEIPVLNLPGDYPRPSVFSFEGDEYRFKLDSREVSRFKELSTANEVTPTMNLMAAFNVLLFKYTDQPDIIVGIGIAGRRHVQLQRVMGLFVNMLAVRNHPTPDKTYLEFLKEIKKSNAQAFENQDMQFENLVTRLKLKRDLSRNPLFDVSLVNLNYERSKKKWENLELVPIEMEDVKDVENKTAIFDLTLFVYETHEEIRFYLEFYTGIFKGETIRRLVNHFKNIIKQVSENPGIRLGDIDMLTDEEKHRLLYAFNDTATYYPQDTTISQLFVQQVMRTPDHIALIGAGTRFNASPSPKQTIHVTYRELNEKSNQLAHRLVQNGVKPDTIVGIMMERSIDMMIGILAILKAGGAYMPIDPDYPQDRINYMLADSGAEILLKDNDFTPDSFGICNLGFGISPPGGQLAYIMYTSGSTGNPKGVLVVHQNVVRLVTHCNYVELGEETRILQTGAPVFDATTFEIWGALLNGGQLVLAKKEIILDANRLGQALKKLNITTLWLSSPLFNHLVQDNWEIFSNLSHLLVGGDVLSPRLINRLRNKNKKLKIINGYGPTENTTFSTTFLIDRDYDDNIPIGRPIGNSTAYILDNQGLLQPIGIFGELWVGGDGVSRGYLNAPELTAERYCLRRPGGTLYAKGARCRLQVQVLTLKGPGKKSFHMSYMSHRSYIYRTGDLCRWLPEGNIEFLGRKDHQVKIRGFRVECGEIENHLLKIDKIKETVVVVKENKTDEKYLCAYFVSEEEFELSTLRNHLAVDLPDYMIPSYFVPMVKMPLTPNGKIDRKALPMPELPSGENYAAPRDEIEKQLVKIWAQVLGRDPLHASQLHESIGIHDNFFELGGHSLKTTIMATKIYKALNVKIPLTEIFVNPTIERLARIIKAATVDQYASIEPAEKKEYYKLSSAQKRLYILQQMEPNVTSYHISTAFELEGVPDIPKLEAVLQRLIRRHESFRTSFQLLQGAPVQRIHDGVEIKVERPLVPEGTTGLAPLPIPAISADRRLQTAQDIINSFIRPFDLSQAPLLRIGLMEVAHPPTVLDSQPRPGTDNSQEGNKQQYILIIDMHHIISDGVSMGVLIDNFMALYEGKELPGLRIQYKDYSEWQKKETETEANQQRKAYWQAQLAGEIPLLKLPTDYPRPRLQNFKGNTLHFEIQDSETKALKSLALKEEVTLFMLLLSAYNIFLARLCSEDDIIVGAPIAARRHPDLRHIIGMFVNTLALRNKPAGDKNFTTFLKEIKEKTLAAFENQEYPFEELVEKASITRDASRNPLFDVMFVLQNVDTAQLELPGLKLKPLEPENNISKFDITLQVIESRTKLFLTLEYCTKLFRKETINRFIKYFKNIVSSVLDNPEQKIANMEILPEEEKQRILFEFNDTAVEYPREKTIHQLFVEQVEQTPDNIAVVGRSEGTRGLAPLSHPIHLTYNQLNRKSHQLAHMLIRNGVKPDTIVAIMMERCVEMIIGILGILKAGGAYLPIDPQYPEERITYMVKDSSAKILLNHNDFTPEAFNNCPKGALPHLHLSPAPVTSLAYIIYTSGSTGKPKGVLVVHQNVVRLVTQCNYVELGEETRILQTGAPVFDATTFEIWGALLNGGQLGLVKKEVILDANRLGQTLKNLKITTLWLSSPLFNQLVQDNDQIFSNLSHLLVGGDVLSTGLINRLRNKNEKLKIINGYGPTENTTFSTTFLIDRDYEDNIPIGRPIANSTAYILDNQGLLQPIGIFGELWVGGDGISRGYLNAPELTAEKFDQDLWDYRDYQDNKNKSFYGGVQKLHGVVFSKRTPLVAEGRFYKTGDLCRWLPEGNIEFLGRKDHQVKIRGFRIECGEIESHLLKIDEIKEVVVVVKENKTGEKYLCAYIAAKEEFDLPGLRDQLAKGLPDYMIPSYFVPLVKMPLTPNGKIDRKALPEPEYIVKKDYTPPGDEIEKQLVQIWAQVLSRDASFASQSHASQLYESIGIHDNFFQLGGHSLKATIVVSKIHKAFNVKIPLAEIFVNPTIQRLAQTIKTAAAHQYVSIKAVEEKEYYELSPAQKRLYILQRMEPTVTSYNLPTVFELEGVPDIPQVEEAVRKLNAKHESFRTSLQLVRGTPVQRIHRHVEFEIERFEGTMGLSPLSADPATRNSQLITNIIKNFIRPFDLSQAPLLRLGLIKTNEQKYILMIDMHHIIADGTSMGVFINDFIALYGGNRLTELRIRYRDYSEWQNKEKESLSLQTQENYWLDQFAGEIPVLNLPFDYPRPLVQSFEGKTLQFEIHEEGTTALKSLSLKEEVTLFMLLLSITNILLSKLSGQEEIIMGTPIAARRHTDLQAIIGMFVNTLVLTNKPRAEKTFKQFLLEVKENTLEAHENQEYPFENLVDKASVPRDASRNPLFDVMLILQNMEMTEIAIPGLKLKPYEYENNTSKFDLTLTGVETGKKLLFTVEYCTKLFKEETILRFISYFKKILSSLQENSNIRIAAISIIPEEEKQLILKRFNETSTAYAADKTLHELFREQAEQTPDYIALLGHTEGKRGLAPLSDPISITYNQLNNRSDQLAYLLKEKGVKADTIVGIMMNRSIEMIIGILGILTAGGAYLPIDPGFPEERITYMLKDSVIGVLLTTPKLQVKVKAEVEEDFRKPPQLPLQFINPGTRLESAIEPSLSTLTSTSTCQVSPANLAYVIYTSGSTGKPKGVMIHHQAVHNFIIGMTQRIDFTPGKTILALTTISFDIFVLETLLPLLQGLRIVIADEHQQLDINLLEELIVKNNIDMLQATPTRMQMFTGNGRPVSCLANLKEIMVGGEPFPGKLLGDMEQLTSTMIYNMYGPTETTVWSTMKDLTLSAVEAINIGQPIANTRIYILDKNDQPQPLGVIGDLYIGGDGLARGYINRPEFTAEKFCLRRPGGTLFEKTAPPGTPRKNFLLKVPCKDNYRSYRSHKSYIYRTGDLARWLPDGNIEFFGRIDSQVKIRGFRIELGEIEKHLMAYSGVKEAVVMDRADTNGNKYLCAYLVLIDREAQAQVQDIDIPKLREYLSRSLPGYMVPSYFIPLEKIPLTANGKVDRKSLPSIDGIRLPVHRKEDYAAPGTDLEKLIANVWKEVLKLKQVGIGDNFFDIGGNSLNILQVNQKLNENLQAALPAMSMFRYTTIHSLAQFLEQQDIKMAMERKKRADTLAKSKRDRQLRYQKRQQSTERIKRTLR